MKALILVLLASLPCMAQEVKIIEKMPDGSYVVSISGVEYRALGADKMKDLLQQKADFETLKQIDSEKDTQIKAQAQEVELLKKDVHISNLERDSYKSDFERVRQDSQRNFNLFMTERDLRVEATQFIPHGSKTGFGKFLSLFDSQGAQTALKLVVPTVTMVRGLQCH